MTPIIQQLEAPARAMGIPISELATIVERGQMVAYDAGACLFHESTPREWMGIVMDGEVEIVRGLQGTRTHLATLTSGALISEGILLDESAHSSSAFARSDGAKVHKIPQAALADVMKAAAMANAELKCLDPKIARCIEQACDEILAGKLHDHFVVDMFQGGAGTSTNMNANEVIANRGLELMGHAKGEYKYLHPNDHVNCSQSTNDAYPTAIKLAVIFSLKDTLAGMRELQASLQKKAKEFAHVLKMGRTENQDAVPMTLGQEFGAYAVMIDTAMA